MSVLSFHTAEALTEGDQHFLLQLLQRMGDSLRQLPGDIIQAQQSGQYAQAALWAHKLKSSTLYLDYAPLNALLEQWEQAGNTPSPQLAAEQQQFLRLTQYALQAIEAKISQIHQ